MKRPVLGLAIVATTAASVTALATHHHKRLASASELASVLPLSPRASRAHVREPLPAVKRHVGRERQGPPVTRASSLRVAVPAAGSGPLSDVTMYCPTGSRNADGRWPEPGDVAVMDRTIPFGTRVLIDGNVYTVRDWIGWGSDFDIFGGNDAACESRALDFGRRRLRVVVER